MPKLPLHPNCKCHYEDVYEKDMPQSLECEKIRNNLLAANNNLSEKDVEKIVSLIIKSNPEMEKYVQNKDEIYMYFNGRYLFSSNGKLILDAVSGKPVAVKSNIKSINTSYTTVKIEHTFDYSKSRQALENTGGLPEGIYTFKCKESGSLLNGNIRKHLLKKSSWGSYHWILQPLPETNTYQRKRNSFTIHGGNNYDSGGCIDLQKNDVILREYLKNVHQTKMFLFVQYDEKKVIISEEHDNFYPLHP